MTMTPVDDNLIPPRVPLTVTRKARSPADAAQDARTHGSSRSRTHTIGDHEWTRHRRTGDDDRAEG